MKKYMFIITTILLCMFISIPVFADENSFTWLLMGDSYSAKRAGVKYDGTIDTLDAAWPDYVQASLKCSAKIVRMPGYGFCRNNMQFISKLTPLKEIPAENRKTVAYILVTGGATNDCWCTDASGKQFAAPESMVRTEMNKFRKEAQKLFPNAKLIYSSVNWGEKPARQEVCINRGKMYRKIALEQGWIYLDKSQNALRVPQSQITSVFFNDNYNGAHAKYGGFHPNAEGQYLLGRTIVAELRQKGLNKTPVIAPTAPEPEEQEEPLAYEPEPVLLARMSTVTANSIKLCWKPVKDAVKYEIWGNQTKFNIKKIGTTRTTSTLRENLKSGGEYKFIIKAIGANRSVIAESVEIYIVTPKSNYTNCNKLELNAHKITLKKDGKTMLSSAKTYSAPKKIKNRPRVTYVSDMPNVAKVTTYGIIEGQAKGTCKIYAIAETGVYDVAEVTIR